MKENHKFSKMSKTHSNNLRRNEIVRNLIEGNNFGRPQSTQRLPIKHIYPELSQFTLKNKVEDRLNQLFPSRIKDITKLDKLRKTKDKIFSSVKDFKYDKSKLYNYF